MNINKSKLSGYMNILTVLLIIIMILWCGGCSPVRYNQAVAENNQAIEQDKARLERLEQDKIDLFCAYNQCDNMIIGKN